jgi:AbrB family looped-hinge helix DNA binding protein
MIYPMMKSTMSSKGQLTVPIELREKLGLEAGTVIRFELRDGAIFMRKGTQSDHPVDRLFGSLRLGKPVDELIDQMRGPRPAVPKKKRAVRRR